jgi:haloacid dehalogenase superfamily, subfamily IA, variant 3 with third motif having DD or ED/haloacid dehalogenase superfamily, subfamily IA, variant 1 with third motif having Dx(3-4)D or Dx(3-4)E
VGLIVEPETNMLDSELIQLNGIDVMQAVIFDMDGTLIDSEPMWKEAEKEIFSSLGVNVSEALSAKTASMTTREVTEFWYSHFPWLGKNIEQVENEVVERVAALISENGGPMEGVEYILNFFQKKEMKIGLSTNAPSRLIPVVLNKLGISHYFHSTSSSEHETQGKPDPAVYLTTAKKLGVEPSKCIAFEDSLSGIIAASKANIKTVAVPPRTEFTDKKYDMSHVKLSRLSDFTDSHLEAIACSN